MYSNSIRLILIGTVVTLSLTDGLRVLGVFPTFGKSHWSVGNGIMMGLIEAGHEVTMISPNPLKKSVKNHRDVITEGVIEFSNEWFDSLDKIKNVRNPLLQFSAIYSTFHRIAELTLTSTSVQTLMKSDEKFDVIVLETFLTEALFGLGEHFNAPMIAVSTFCSNKWVNDIVGTPDLSAVIPRPFLAYTQDMTFLERLLNTLFALYHDAFVAFVELPKQREYYYKYFPNAKRTFEEARWNVSLVFVNTHIALSNPVPYVPNMIDIGGVNIDRTNKQLPKKLESIIGSAKYGVIYFSLGSHVPSSKIPKSTLEIFINGFRKLNETVLWKLDKPEIIGNNVPKNLYTNQWFPQNEVLAHPNVKLFITQGGLLSTTESVYHGKPIIGVPVLGDQHLNIAKAVQSGFALRIDFETITQKEFDSALQEMLLNPKYQENVKRISNIYRDQTMTPRQTVAYWTEYVVRHNGAPHMHSKSVELNYFARNSIDVMVTILIGFTIVFVAVISCSLKLVRCTLGMIQSVTRNNNEKKTK